MKITISPHSANRTTLRRLMVLRSYRTNSFQAGSIPTYATGSVRCMTRDLARCRTIKPQENTMKKQARTDLHTSLWAICISLALVWKWIWPWQSAIMRKLLLAKVICLLQATPSDKRMSLDRVLKLMNRKRRSTTLRHSLDLLRYMRKVTRTV